MPEIDIDLYCEDIDQEFFVRPLVERIAAECEVVPVVTPRSVRGGKGKVTTQVTAFQQAVRKNQPGFSIPDLVVIAIDANCAGVNEAREQVADIIRNGIYPRVAIACPDPHIERWYMADPAAFASVVGTDPSLPEQKCGKDVYKALLRSLVDEGDVEVLLGAYELGPDLAAAMDLYAAGKADAGFKIFAEEVRVACTAVQMT
jgi:hypothetical protein